MHNFGHANSESELKQDARAPVLSQKGMENMNVQNIRGRFDCSPSIMMHSMDAFCGPINPQNFNHLCGFTQLHFYGIELASGFRVNPHAAEVIGSCRFYIF